MTIIVTLSAPPNKKMKKQNKSKNKNKKKQQKTNIHLHNNKTTLKMQIYEEEVIGFTFLYFKMAVIPLVPETKMMDVGKLISLGNLLVWKVT